MSSLRALEREATLAGSCYVTLARWIRLRSPSSSAQRSLGVPGSEDGLNLFGVRLAVLARVKPSDENIVFRLIASFQ